MKNVLIVAPHADDDVLGCGGIISKYAENGWKIYVAIMTNGNVGDPELFPIEGTKKGRKEALLSHKVLGVRETFFFDFPAPRLETFPGYKISIALEKLIKDLKIEVLFLPHRGDIHMDHKAVFQAGIVAARPINKCPVKNIYSYETLSETEWAAPYSDDVFFPTFFVQLSENNLNKKIEAFNCYSPPRKKEFPHPRSTEGIINLAKLRGGTVESEFAEAFMHIRSIEDSF